MENATRTAFFSNVIYYISAAVILHADDIVDETEVFRITEYSPHYSYTEKTFNEEKMSKIMLVKKAVIIFIIF